MKIENYKLKIGLFLPVIIVLLIFIYLFAKNLPNNSFSPKVATVNGIAVTKYELERQVAFTKNFYTYSKQNLSNYPTLEKDILERLIEDKLVEQYAINHNIKVSDEEVLALYKQKVSKTPESELLSKLKAMYGMGKSDYLKVLEKDILREKVQKSVKIPLLEWLIKEKQKSEVFYP